MWYSSAVRLNMLAHQVPSLNQSLLWGFSPVGLSTALAEKEKSRYPTSSTAEATPTYARSIAKVAPNNRTTDLMSSSTPSCVVERSEDLSREPLRHFCLLASASHLQTCQQDDNVNVPEISYLAYKNSPL